MEVERAQAETWASWFRALGDPSRILILNLLATSGRPLSVGEIVDVLGLAQSTVSHHLKILGEVGFALVEREVDGELVAGQRALPGLLPVGGRGGDGSGPGRHRTLERVNREGEENPMNEPSNVEAEVRRYYADAAVAAGDGSAACCGPEAERFGAGLYDDLDGPARRRHPGQHRVREPGRRGRPPPRRGRARPRVGRRDRRAAVGPPGRADRPGLRGGLHARDARPGPPQRRRGRRHQRRVPGGPHRRRPAAGRFGGRDHLQLRGQPGRRQGRRVHRDAPAAASRAGGSGSATSSPRTASPPPSGPSGAATSAASPARWPCRTTGPASRPPG